MNIEKIFSELVTLDFRRFDWLSEEFSQIQPIKTAEIKCDQFEKKKGKTLHPVQKNKSLEKGKTHMYFAIDYVIIWLSNRGRKKSRKREKSGCSHIKNDAFVSYFITTSQEYKSCDFISPLNRIL
jgi:hypothetical protein